MDNTVELKRDFWFGVATIAFSIFLFFSIRFFVSDSAFTGISGRMFPYVIDAFFLILGTALCLDSKSRLSHCENGECIEFNNLSKKQICDILTWIVMVCLYILGISYIGFMVSTFAVLAASLWFLGLRKPVPFIIMVAICPPLLWWVFHKLVEVQFPDALLI